MPTSLPFSEQTKHFIVLVLEMTKFATNETFPGVVHTINFSFCYLHPHTFAFKVLNLHAPLQLCFLIVVSQH